MFINIDNTDINYEIFGDENSKPLLILHGWMASINAMAPIWRYFQNTRKVIVLDFPGQGGKSKEPPTSWGVPEYGEMVKHFIEKLGLKKVDVIGHSFGGRVIIYLASKYPEIFDKIVLTDAAGIKPKMTFKKWIRIRSYKMGKFFIKFVTPKNKYDEKINELRKKYGSSDYASISSEVMRETFNKVISLDLSDKLKDIKNPTLLMWGENDIDTPLYMAKKMEKEIKDSGLVVLKGAGHFSYIDSPNEYNLIVENFLGGN